MTKKLIGKLLAFKFVGRKNDILGVVLDFNDSWTLIRNCAEYSPDGFTVFKNEKMEYYFGEKEKMATKILKLKRYSYQNDPKIALGSLDEILKSINKKYALLQIETRKGDAFDVVSYLGQEDSLYLFDELTTTAKWRYKLRLAEKECRIIGFDSNYLNSLKLVTKFK